ncbi:MAG: phosphatase PAP2 family protein [Planctomycetes bacterium]|nr:phosphatase PAP2 family protein [Planctomycetota bacterium]
MAARPSTNVAAAGLVCILAGCAENRFTRHFHGGPWRDGAAAQFTAPERVIPEAAAAGATLLLLASDELGLVDDEALDHESSTGDTSSSDEYRDGLRWTALGWSAVSLLRGDQARALEVGLETWAINTLATRGLKELAGRERPNGSNDSSFPSGHSSSAFSAATFLARSVDDAFEGPWGKLGYLAFVPAVHVAEQRVSSHVHYPSDVVAGALLGFFVANTIYDAHYGAEAGEDSGDSASIFFGRRGDLVWGLTPSAVDDRLALAFFVSF